ncbi:hypothetical protein OCU04_011927 [Sclerotinia nivalis]|uniref:Uncharacterized protein n=1 Tax=Sclerotinia nivalis TaxID=352851 RepID=A0A9X0AA24_9HELO|nr:hypothetical protein OCU04_011927 [Sclerotinia nivalis]
MSRRPPRQHVLQKADLPALLTYRKLFESSTSLLAFPLRHQPKKNLAENRGLIVAGHGSQNPFQAIHTHAQALYGGRHVFIKHSNMFLRGSVLFKSLTGSTGHLGDGIDSVTHEYQVDKVVIEKQLDLIVNTPGFDDPNISNADFLRGIASLLTKDSVKYTGILYVHLASTIFSEETQGGLKLFQALCDLNYSLSSTFVTTVWDCLSSRKIRKKHDLITELIKAKWSLFIERGANSYHHGICYGNGRPTFDVLDLKDGKTARRNTARQRIAVIYPPYKEYTSSLIVEALIKQPQT